MKTDKHSPGPWHAHANGEGQPLRRIGCTVGPNPGGGYSSVCVALIPEASERATADALLIAAAPDLLAALRNLLAAVEDPSGFAAALMEKEGAALQAFMAEQERIETAAVEAARAAVRKAVGAA